MLVLRRLGFALILLHILMHSSAIAEEAQRKGICPACEAESILEAISIEERLETEKTMAETGDGFYRPFSLHECPNCHLITHDDYFDSSVITLPPEMSAGFKQFVQSPQLLAELQAPSFFRAAQAAEYLAEEDSESADKAVDSMGLFLAGICYATASWQAEGGKVFGHVYDGNPMYIESGLRESARCFTTMLSRMEGIALFAGLQLQAAYMCINMHRRLGDFDNAVKAIAVFDLLVQRFESSDAVDATDLEHLRECAASQKILVEKRDSQTRVRLQFFFDSEE